MPLPRPTLLPGLARSWRGSRTLQLGADPARAVLIDLPETRAAEVLGLLDGSRSVRAVLQQATEHGLSADEAHTLVETLTAAGFVIPAPSLAAPTPHLAGESAALALRPDSSTAPSPARILRRRAAARVLVTGAGRLGPAIAAALAEAGVGHVHPDVSGSVSAAELPGSPLRHADVGHPRAQAVVSSLTRAAPSVRTGGIRRGSATLAIQLGHDQPVSLLAAALIRRRQPHLAVAIREGVPAVGPLVPATGSPCLNCVDLHRRDRDPGWTGYLVTAEPCAVATVMAATALATADALAFLDGEVPQTLGATIEVRTPGQFRRRTWHPHPDCPCTRVRR